MSKKLSLVLILGWQLLRADTPGIRVVNGASFMQDTSLAPGAIISIFGSTTESSPTAIKSRSRNDCWNIRPPRKGFGKKTFV